MSLLSIFVVLNLGDLGSHFLEVLSPPSAYDWCYEQPDLRESMRMGTMKLGNTQATLHRAAVGTRSKQLADGDLVRHN